MALICDEAEIASAIQEDSAEISNTEITTTPTADELPEAEAELSQTKQVSESEPDTQPIPSIPDQESQPATQPIPDSESQPLQDADPESKDQDTQPVSDSEVKSEDEAGAEAGTSLGDSKETKKNKKGTNKEPKRHECSFCEQSFTNTWGLKTHTRIHTGELPYSCHVCGQCFRRSHHMKRHTLTHSNTKPFSCPTCDKSFTRKEKLTAHTKKFNGTCVPSPEGADPGEGGAIKTEGSSQKQTPQRPRVAQNKKSSPMRGALRANNMHQLQVNAAIVKQQNDMYGDHYDPEFENWAAASIPQIELTESDYLPCDYCFEKFTTKLSLELHIYIHTGIRPFPCRHHPCHQSFLAKSNRDEHERIHTGALPFGFNFWPWPTINPANAEDQYSRKSKGTDPSDPTSTPTKSKRGRKKLLVKPTFTCDYCDFTSNKKFRVKIHTRVHTGEQPYSCDTCGQSFRRSHHLTRHRLTHTGERPHGCPTCDKTFTRKEKLTLHMKKCPKEEGTPEKMAVDVADKKVKGKVVEGDSETVVANKVADGDLETDKVEDTNAGKGEGTDTGKGEGTDTGKGEGTDTGKGEGTDTGKGEGTDTGKGEGTDTGKAEGTDTEKVEETHTDKAAGVAGEKVDTVVDETTDLIANKTANTVVNEGIAETAADDIVVTVTHETVTDADESVSAVVSAPLDSSTATVSDMDVSVALSDIAEAEEEGENVAGAINTSNNSNSEYIDQDQLVAENVEVFSSADIDVAEAMDIENSEEPIED